MDWAGLLRLGLTGLGLSPGAFWRLTPIELLVMLGAEAANAPLTRRSLNELARRFPDQNMESKSGE